MGPARRVFLADGKDPNTPTDPPPTARIDASPGIVIAACSSPVGADHLDMAPLRRIAQLPGPAGGHRLDLESVPGLRG